MKRILGLTIAFMLLIGMAGIGTWAYFSIRRQRVSQYRRRAERH